MSARAPLRLGFAGTPEFAVPALTRLAAHGGVQAVFTQPDRPAGRGQTLTPSPVKRAALGLGIPVLQPVSFKSPDAPEMLRALALDCLVVAAYGQILPPAALKLPRLGCINIHASLLPRWRGAAPIQRALLEGDAATGITLMQMEAGLDTGPMLKAARLDIAADDTGGSLHDKLAQLGADLIDALLLPLAQGALEPQPQPDAGVTYAAKIHKGEARIDWRAAAIGIERRVRAFNPWPIAETRFAGEQLRVFEALALAGDSGEHPGTVLAATGEGIEVACGRGRLRICKLQQAGRKPLAARDFLSGLRAPQSLKGAVFESPATLDASQA